MTEAWFLSALDDALADTAAGGVGSIVVLSHMDLKDACVNVIQVHTCLSTSGMYVLS